MERQSIRRLIEDNTARHTLVSRLGVADVVDDLMRRAYRVGLHNGKIIGSKRPLKSGEPHNTSKGEA